jgi:hypothetical protein
MPESDMDDHGAGVAVVRASGRRIPEGESLALGPSRPHTPP